VIRKMLNVRLPRSLTALLIALALGAPFVLVARAGRALIEPLTAASVAVLLRVSAPLTEVPAAPPPTPELEDAPSELAQHVTRKPAARTARPVMKAPPAGVYVSQGTVLRLARTSARPRGSFVSGAGERPAGLRLSGVAALGIGLEDGDILVEALGLSPRSAGEIIGAVIEARARRVAALSGTLWRRGQTFHITVEQPY